MPDDLGGYPHSFLTAFLCETDPDYQIQLDGTELYSYADAGIGFACHDLTYAIWESM